MGWGGVGRGNNVHVPVHTQAQQPHHLSCCPADTGTALSRSDTGGVGWVTLSDPLFGAPSEPPTAVTHMGCFTGTIAFLADLGMHLQIMWKRTKVLARKKSMLTVPLLMLWAGVHDVQYVWYGPITFTRTCTHGVMLHWCYVWDPCYCILEFRELLEVVHYMVDGFASQHLRLQCEFS